MSIEHNRPPNYLRIHLSTALLLMFAVPVGVLCYLRSSPWEPEDSTMTHEEELARFPHWNFQERRYSPDGTRKFNTGYFGEIIVDAKSPELSKPLYTFAGIDFGDELHYNLQLYPKNPLVHHGLGFIDDDHCLFVHCIDPKSKPPRAAYRIWRRRFPEWWWGHFYRPEVWGGGVLGLILLIVFVRFVKADNARILGDRARREAEKSSVLR